MGTIPPNVPPSLRYSCAEELSLKWSADVECVVSPRYVGTSKAARIVCHDGGQSVLDILLIMDTIES